MQRDKWDELYALAEHQHAAFTTAQAAEIGIDSNGLARLRRDHVIDWLRPRVHAIYRLLDEWTPMAGVQLAQPRAVAGHRAAGRLHRYDAISIVDDIVVPRNVRMRGSNVRRVEDLVLPEVVVVDGIRCTDEVRTLCDLGAVESAAVVERAVESLLRRRPNALPLLVDRATALARKGKSGPTVLLTVLEQRPAVPTESDLETVYWQVLRDHDVELPIRQHPVGPYFLDLAYIDAKVFVEIDGWGSHGSVDAFGRDRRRQNDIVLLDWVPLRFTHSDVHRFPRRTAMITATTVRRRRALLVA
ncbi:MAG: hypothetical protein QOD30_1366 [Actinomycetota bacterium]|nr:hypothetical protein [Actinomycetota bacterium]